MHLRTGSRVSRSGGQVTGPDGSVAAAGIQISLT